ncbi:MAG: DUF4124 domain-containing protein, partial [Candidatus Ozemobacteraceae bacterium]
MKKILTILFVFLALTAFAGEIYYGVDKNGNPVMSDRPLPKDVKEAPDSFGKKSPAEIELPQEEISNPPEKIPETPSSQVPQGASKEGYFVLDKDGQMVSPSDPKYLAEEEERKEELKRRNEEQAAITRENQAIRRQTEAQQRQKGQEQIGGVALEKMKIKAEQVVKWTKQCMTGGSGDPNTITPVKDLVEFCEENPKYSFLIFDVFMECVKVGKNTCHNLGWIVFARPCEALAKSMATEKFKFDDDQQDEFRTFLIDCYIYDEYSTIDSYNINEGER